MRALFLSGLATLVLVGCASTTTKEDQAAKEKPAVEVKDTVYLESSFSVVNKTEPGQDEIQSTENIWIVEPKTTLKRVLEQWAERASWDVSYETGAVVELYNTKPVELYGESIRAATMELSKTLTLPSKGIFVVPYPGNSIIRVFSKEQANGQTH
ncbi:MAG: hypothetical protein AB7C96_12630 [Hydrogenovibrio sp.]